MNRLYSHIVPVKCERVQVSFIQHAAVLLAIFYKLPRSVAATSRGISHQYLHIFHAKQLNPLHIVMSNSWSLRQLPGKLLNWGLIGFPRVDREPFKINVSALSAFPGTDLSAYPHQSGKHTEDKAIKMMNLTFSSQTRRKKIVTTPKHKAITGFKKRLLAFLNQHVVSGIFKTVLDCCSET